ncbi:eIF4-gamma/eIF5/eIF2-epsilon [Sodiomyces alkalinus F11]|uniref:Mannose-1-phosphate guanyltransferase n=1 Tax=Sodiomyces alkalinus (strain CBS 110278 / VKM F-3762 / F11) TaxID=1314773 RepID=A0A3N2PMJ6_SODAK|nr:eIF4-gamma/eIF5/eIF2-epsilon [Sodiomyces alkalinus F11]ROT35752.1 eIF4-gamma/eIF5/eIF2-epsilon [Sodiomyces alkalinus F11]
MSHHKGKSGKKPARAAEAKREDVLQAVIIADSFQDRFQPLTIDKPRCLLPLANTPLIEYTLEFLAMNGVQEVHIYPGAHGEQVEDYINRSRWATESGRSPFSGISFIRVSDARSIGDFLRDLDKRGYIDGDFILVHGDLVSNMSLDRVLAAHKARRQAAATNIMTLVLRSGGEEQHRTKANAITPVFVVDTKTKRCLHYDETHPLQSDHYLTLDPAVIDELSTDFEIRADLIDAQIDICTPEVLALWSESFDYELPRRNFLHGVLKDWELNGKAIYVDVLEEGYAARASNLQMYESISRDVMGRWTFPFIPECNILPDQGYQMRIYGVSTEDGVEIASNSKLSNSIIGRDAAIGSGSTVIGSVIGRRCKIGQNVVIEDSYVWDDTTIDDGAVISRSILGYSTVVGKRASIPAGSVLSRNVVVGDDVKLQEPAVLSVISHDGSPVTTDTSLLGPSGKGAPYVDPEAEEIDPEDPSTLQRSLIYSLAHLSLSSSSISTLDSEGYADSDDDSLATPFSGDTSRTRLSSFASDDSGAALGNTSFHHDAVQGLLDALRDDTGDFEPAKLEFMGLRLANDASDAQMRRAVAVAFARRAAELLTPEHGGLDASKAADRALSRKGASTFIHEVGVGDPASDAEQVEFILSLQKALVSLVGSSRTLALEKSRAGTLLAALLQQLYNLDVLEEEGILAWWAEERALGGGGGGGKDGELEDKMKAVRERCRVLVEWLENASEEEDDDDDDDEDDSDDE